MAYAIFVRQSMIAYFANQIYLTLCNTVAHKRC